MKMRRAAVIAIAAFAFTGIGAPAAMASTTTSAGAAAAATDVSILRTYHATVQCQIVRISDNNVVAYERADGSGNTEQAAKLDAERNIPVPQGHYKRHCDVKRRW
ncbi:hypothetical protein GCM10010168_09700 [Actinoplanes ianthinogenes]|nr:hypothetical protein [Actinoplanes ianthinogenes]GGQ96144.1 hypothetical protein GCM10010168_09700 [Actinoplanes ianthinogenes]